MRGVGVSDERFRRAREIIALADDSSKGCDVDQVMRKREREWER